MVMDIKVKKAQLILVGGRPVPNMLTILYEKPDIIVCITSSDFETEVPFLKKAVNTLLEGRKCEIDVHLVDAFDISQIKAACEKAIEKHKDADWLFNITNATTIMSIGAYEVAQKHHDKVKWWYLDTSNTRVITESNKEINEKLYRIGIEQYVIANYCSMEEKYKEEEKKLQAQNWLPFILRLGTNTELPPALKSITEKIQQIDQGRARQRKDADIQTQKRKEPTKEPYELSGLTSISLTILEDAARLNIVNELTLDGNQCKFSLTPFQFQFLNGTWLEVYVHHSLKSLVTTDSIEWGKYIFDRNGKSQELDVVLIYKAKLFLVECKTGKDAFEQKTFQTFDTIVKPIGGNFVTKIIVTSLSEDNASNLEEMEMRAKAANIKHFYKDTLPSIGEELMKFVLQSKGN